MSTENETCEFTGRERGREVIHSSPSLRRWVYSREKRPLSVRDPVRHLAVEGLLNFLHNVPSSGRFDKLTIPVDASRESCRERANFDCIPSA